MVTDRTAGARAVEQTWLVLRRKDTEPWEVAAFNRYDEAAMFWDRQQANWSTVYFCRVAACEGKPLDVQPVIIAFREENHALKAALAAAEADRDEWRRAFGLRTSGGWQTAAEAKALWDKVWTQADGARKAFLDLHALWLKEEQEAIDALQRAEAAEADKARLTEQCSDAAVLIEAFIKQQNAAESKLSAAAQEIAALAEYAKHKEGCGYQLTGGQIVHNSELRGYGYPEVHVPNCTCGLSALAARLKGE